MSRATEAMRPAPAPTARVIELHHNVSAEAAQQASQSLSPTSPAHSFYMQKACIGSVSIGLPGKAVKGEHWDVHRAKFFLLFVRILEKTPDIIGILVSEVGSTTDMYDDDSKAKFDDLFKEAFDTAALKKGAREHGELQIFWATGTAANTVMVFKAHVAVRMLECMTRMPGLDDWRRIEVAQLRGATEHGETTSMIIYHSNKLSTVKDRKPKLVQLCKMVLQHAIRKHRENPESIGFVLAGEPQCTYLHWAMALSQEQTYRLHFQGPQFVYVNADIAASAQICRAGDKAVIMGIKGLEALQFNLIFRSMPVVIVGWTWNGRRFEHTLAGLRERVYLLEDTVATLQERLNALVCDSSDSI